MTRQSFKILCFLWVTIILAGCSSDYQKITATCKNMETVAQMTDDCDKMAQNLAPLTEKTIHLMKKFDQQIPDEPERSRVIDAFSICMRAHFEISAGTCKDHPEVRKHLLSMPQPQ